MALEFPSELIMTDTDFSYSVLGQIFLQQVCASPRLLVQLQSNCIIIILLYIFNLYESKFFSTLHHCKLTDVIVVVHLALIDFLGARYVYIERL